MRTDTEHIFLLISKIIPDLERIDIFDGCDYYRDDEDYLKRIVISLGNTRVGQMKLNGLLNSSQDELLVLMMIGEKTTKRFICNFSQQPSAIKIGPNRFASNIPLEEDIAEGGLAPTILEIHVKSIKSLLLEVEKNGVPQQLNIVFESQKE